MALVHGERPGCRGQLHFFSESQTDLPVITFTALPKLWSKPGTGWSFHTQLCQFNKRAEGEGGMGALFYFWGGMEHPKSCSGIRWIFMDAVAKRDSMVPILCGNSDSDLP